MIGQLLLWVGFRKQSIETNGFNNRNWHISEFPSSSLNQQKKHVLSPQHSVAEQLRVLETRKMTDVLTHAVRRHRKEQSGVETE